MGGGGVDEGKIKASEGIGGERISKQILKLGKTPELKAMQRPRVLRNMENYWGWQSKLLITKL